MAGGGEMIVPCLIYDGMTYEDEVALCYSLDKAKRQLNLSQATKALLESGAANPLSTHSLPTMARYWRTV